jgi:hypothetical protein
MTASGFICLVCALAAVAIWIRSKVAIFRDWLLREARSSHDSG